MQLLFLHHLDKPREHIKAVSSTKYRYFLIAESHRGKLEGLIGYTRQADAATMCYIVLRGLHNRGNTCRFQYSGEFLSASKVQNLLHDIAFTGIDNPIRTQLFRQFQTVIQHVADHDANAHALRDIQCTHANRTGTNNEQGVLCR